MGPSLLFDGHSPRPTPPSNAHPLDYFACDMAQHSPFAQLKATTEVPSHLPANLAAGRCTSPDTVYPCSHVEKVMLPRVQALIASHNRSSSRSSSKEPIRCLVPSASNGTADPGLSDMTYTENQQLDELMHVIQLHTSNVFSMKEYAVPLAEELRTLLSISASSAPSLGATPDATARPHQFVCACLIRANLMFVLADHLFRSYASLDPETGFGLLNTPTTGTADAAAVREAEGLLHDSLLLHDMAAEALSRRSLKASGQAGTAHSGSPPPVSPISDTDDSLRSVQHVQPRSKVMLRYALVQAALCVSAPYPENCCQGHHCLATSFACQLGASCPRALILAVPGDTVCTARCICFCVVFEPVVAHPSTTFLHHATFHVHVRCSYEVTAPHIAGASASRQWRHSSKQHRWIRGSPS